MSVGWCEDCGDELDFDNINDGPNGEWLCHRCIKKPEYQEVEDE